MPVRGAKLTSSALFFFTCFILHPSTGLHARGYAIAELTNMGTVYLPSTFPRTLH
jgi:hypothetical protein